MASGQSTPKQQIPSSGRLDENETSQGAASIDAMSPTLLPDPVMKPGLGSSLASPAKTAKILEEDSSAMLEQSRHTEGEETRKALRDKPELGARAEINPASERTESSTSSTYMNLAQDLKKLEQYTTTQILRLSGVLDDLKLNVAKLQVTRHDITTANIPAASTTSHCQSSSTEFSAPRSVMVCREEDFIIDNAGINNSSDQKPSAGAADGGTDHYQPLYISSLPLFTPSKPEDQPLPAVAMHVFTRSFLESFLGSENWNCGLYYPTTYYKARKEGRSEEKYESNESMKQGAYYLLDPTHDPFLPKKPGNHGARIGVFFRTFELENEEEIYQNVPAFVRVWPSFLARDENGHPVDTGHEYYTYFGTYSQRRWSDKLDCDRIAKHVPSKLHEHWARKLCDMTTRPEWMEEALKESLTPKPGYDGPITADETDEAAIKEFQEAMTAYMHDLREWEAEATANMNKLSQETMLAQFEKPDMDCPPGLRFQWEYLECVGFDYAFYCLLMEELKELGKASALEQRNAKNDLLNEEKIPESGEQAADREAW